MSKSKYVNLASYIEEVGNINDVLDDLKAENLTSRGKYSDEGTEVDIENGVLAVDSSSGEYNPAPINIPYGAWYTYNYELSSNELYESHEAGTRFGFSRYWDIEILICNENQIRKKTPRGKGDNDWWEAVQRYISFINYSRSDLKMESGYNLTSRFLWNLLKQIKKNSNVFFDEEATSFTYEKMIFTQDICNSIEDLTECIQTIEPKLRKSASGEMLPAGDDVLKFRPKTEKSKDSITYEYFETKVNGYLKQPEIFYKKNDLKEYFPEPIRNIDP